MIFYCIVYFVRLLYGFGPVSSASESFRTMCALESSVETIYELWIVVFKVVVPLVKNVFKEDRNDR